MVVDVVVVSLVVVVLVDVVVVLDSISEGFGTSRIGTRIAVMSIAVIKIPMRIGSNHEHLLDVAVLAVLSMVFVALKSYKRSFPQLD